MDNSNTILIVILIVAVLGFGAYMYAENQEAKTGDDSSLQLKLQGDGASQD